MGKAGTAARFLSATGTTAEVELGSGVTIVDPATGQSQSGSTLTLGSAPRIARPIPESLLTQAAANHALPFPWGGDFNLKYESVTGTSSTGGWNTIPAEDQWHTLTWDIADSQFVGKWGYHFALDSDSTDNSQYALQSLSVTRL